MYWAFKEAIPPKICDDIIKYYHLKKGRQKLAVVGGTANNGNNLNKQELKKLINQKFKNQTEASKSLGVSRMTINNWLKGRTKPAPYLVQLLKKVK